MHSQSQIIETKKRIQIKYKEDDIGTYWWSDKEKKKEIEYLYMSEDDYEKCGKKIVIAGDTIRSETPNGMSDVHQIVTGISDKETSINNNQRISDHTEESRQGCYNCLSQDHPPHKCLLNPVESSPLYMPSAECTNCESRGHVKSMCKIEGGPCHGLAGAFPKGTSSAYNQPLVVTIASDVTSSGDPLPASISKKQKFQTTNQTSLLPKTEYDTLQDKLHFTSLKQSREDFLVLFGDKCERYKRKHVASAYCQDDVEIGFTTPADSCYRPLGENARKIHIRVMDLTKGLKYPPQTAREQSDRRRKADQPSKAGGEIGSNLPSDQKKRRRVKYSGLRCDATSASAPSTTGTRKVLSDDDANQTASQLRKLLEIAEQIDSDNKRLGKSKGTAKLKNGSKEAIDELQRRREKQKERRREEVREFSDMRRRMRQEEAEPKPPRYQFAQSMFLEGFAFPKGELMLSKQRVDKSKKGGTFVSELCKTDSVLGLFPKPQYAIPVESEPSRQPRRPSTAPTSRTAASRIPRASNLSEEESEVPATSIPPQSCNRSEIDDGTMHSILKDWRKLWHPTMNRYYYAHKKSNKRVWDINKFICENPPPTSNAIVNWKLKCVEDFNDQQPPPQELPGDSGKLRVSGLNCGYWSSRFLSHQFQSQVKLNNQLKTRKSNREVIYTNAQHLAALSKKASKQAVMWGVSGGGQQTLAKDPKNNCDLWTATLKETAHQSKEIEQRADFYQKILSFCAAAGFPSSEESLQLLNNIRSVIIDTSVELPRPFLIKVVNATPPMAHQEQQVGRILNFAGSVLGIDVTPIITAALQSQPAADDPQMLLRKMRRQLNSESDCL